MQCVERYEHCLGKGAVQKNKSNVSQMLSNDDMGNRRVDNEDNWSHQNSRFQQQLLRTVEMELLVSRD